ncbi:hypothetical protein F4803DRAFT_197946 [Xylaria telfairii]|nr:hypothetical protein F4803DRAFT_197946 [Xylaria telfairii]
MLFTVPANAGTRSSRAGLKNRRPNALRFHTRENRLISRCQRTPACMSYLRSRYYRYLHVYHVYHVDMYVLLSISGMPYIGDCTCRVAHILALLYYTSVLAMPCSTGVSIPFDRRQTWVLSKYFACLRGHRGSSGFGVTML